MQTCSSTVEIKASIDYAYWQIDHSCHYIKAIGMQCILLVHGHCPPLVRRLRR